MLRRKETDYPFPRAEYNRMPEAKPSAKYTDCAIVILAAGKGTRMRSSLPKVMHRVAHEPMISHVLRAASALNPKHLAVVIAPGMDNVRQAVETQASDAVCVIQEKQFGTGHAVRCAEDALRSFSGNVLILYGDTPLIRPETLIALQEKLESDPKTVLVTLGMRLDNPTGYGRLITTRKGTLERIVECKDASAKEKAVRLCNSGVMMVRVQHLFSLLASLTTANQSGEYYLTDIVGHARRQKLGCGVLEADPSELSGINDRAQLAQAEQALQSRLRKNAMLSGVTLIGPESVYLSADTSIGPDTVIGPNVIIAPGVSIGSGVEIRAFCHLEKATVADGSVIGPFARLRPGTALEENVHIGNFVETKQTHVKRGAKINHLSYVGDAVIGAGANIGAGTITCNYDGFHKHKTHIGAGAFIGSNTSLVAPVTIGEGAITGAGSVITKDVPVDALSLERSTQTILLLKAREIRNKRSDINNT